MIPRLATAGFARRLAAIEMTVTRVAVVIPRAVVGGNGTAAVTLENRVHHTMLSALFGTGVGSEKAAMGAKHLAGRIFNRAAVGATCGKDTIALFALITRDCTHAGGCISLVSCDKPW